MKRMLKTWLLAILAGVVTLGAQESGRQFTSLWKEYEKAHKADRPQKEAAALSKIKEAAVKQHLPVDFYDAATLYVYAVQRRDWKQRDTLRRQLEEDVKAFDEPIVTFLWMKEWKYSSPEDLLTFVEAHSKALEANHKDLHHGVQNILGGCFVDFIGTDREYALWALEEYDILEKEYKGVYPHEAVASYERIVRQLFEDRSEARKAWEELAAKYAGRAFSVWPRAQLLQFRMEELVKDKAGSDAFRALYEEASALEKERVAYTGAEGKLVAGCKLPSSLMGALKDKWLRVAVHDGKVQVMFQNLDKATVTLREGKKTLQAWKVENPARSFYVEDTVSLPLPVLPDGEYSLEVREDFTGNETMYEQYTLSVASRKDSRGHCVYVADFETGVPLRSATVALLKNGKEIAGASLMLDGFTPLPESFQKHLKDTRAGFQLVVKAGNRRSRPLYLSSGYSPKTYDSHVRCNIYKDRGAYNPGDTLQFKAIVFDGDPARSLQVVKGRKVEVRLHDAEDNVVETLHLTTNAWGSVSGRFVIPEGHRGGRWELEAVGLGADWFRVDEFVLPTFDLTFDVLDGFYLVGADVPVSGKLVSYSGHSLSGARVHVSVNRYGTSVLEQDLPVGADNRFETAFPAMKAGYYEADVTVTEASGEMHSFREGWYIGENLSVDVRVRNAADADCRWEVVTSRTLALELQAKDAGGNAAALPVRYELTTPDGKVVLFGGEVASAQPFSLELPGDGLYVVRASVSARKAGGETVSAETKTSVLSVLPGSRVLSAGVGGVFLPGPLQVAAGGEISARLGSSEGDAWALVTLYGDGRQVLENKAVHVANGTLEDIRFAYKDSYPEAVRLQVFYFIHGKSVSYEREFRREKDKYTLPLQFTRFTDKAYPGARYTFTVKTAPGAEVLVAAWDKSMDAIGPNDWPLVNLRDFSVESVSVAAACGRVAGNDRIVIGYGRGPGLLSKASRNMAVAEDLIMEEAVPFQLVEQKPSFGGVSAVPVREEFASALTFQPQLYPGKDGTVEFSFRTSDKLSTYYLRVYAHDKAMHNAMVTDEMVVSLPVKVSLMEPRYLYEGDRYEAAVTVSSVADASVSGVLSLMAGDKVRQVRVEIPAGGTVTEYYPVEASSPESLTLTASFKAADFSDAVRVTVPVYPAAQQLTEAHSAVLLPGMDREALLAELRSRFVNVPASEASLREISVREMVEAALPSHVEPAGNDVLSLSEAWYVAQLCHLESDLLEKILSCRNADGGFGWFEGMTSSPVITAVLLERFARLRDRGFEVPDMTATVNYLDKNQFGTARPVWNGWIGDAQYVYVRSLYPGVPFEEKAVTAAEKKRWKEFTKEVKRELVPSAREGRGLEGQILGKARRLLTLRSLLEKDGGLALAKAWGISLGTSARLKASIKADTASLLEYAVQHRDGGWYYPGAVMPWRGLLESEAYAHALLCQLLDGTEVADGIRLWLMLQKETQKWEATPAFVDAVTAVLDGSEELLSTRVLAFSASYEAPFSSVKAAGNGFTIERKFFRDGVEIRPGDAVAVGDRICVKYLIWNGENRSFVKVTAGREASLAPVQQLSGPVGHGFIVPLRSGVAWGFVPQGYREVKASCTEYYFDSYPEENTTLTEEFFVERAGSFQAPVVTVESLYAPHYRANSGFRVPLEVFTTSK